jgi:eukaryotic-like serine/threonine-protein kinase
MTSSINRRTEAFGSDYRATGQGSDLPDDPRLISIVQEYFERLQAGQEPRADEYLRLYPDLADSLRICLGGLDLIYDAVASDRSVDRESVMAKPDGEHPKQLGDFRIEREVGSGGMGVVYEATQLSLRRRVALKVLSFAATLQKKQLQRFLNEAQAAAHLHHTHIVPVFAVGCERGVHYYAMQFIDGMSLAELLSQLRRDAQLSASDAPSRSPLSDSLPLTSVDDASECGSSSFRREIPKSVDQLSKKVSTLKSRDSGDFFRMIATWMRQAAEALAYAHDLGIVHRDVKPGNLMLDGGSHLWVTDFGLAQIRAAADLTQTGDLIGTLRYMSPEQVSGDRQLIDHRTDVYSLGATLYELATLRPVYDGRTREALLQNVARGEPRPPRSINRRIPLELETIILKATSRFPQDRYASAQALADDLQRFIDDKPILARRPSIADRLRRWSRRHPSSVAAIVVLLVLLSTGLAIHNRIIAREQMKTAEALQREEQRAKEAEQRFQQARRAVDVLIETSEEDLANDPRLFATRKRLLQTAVTYYESFIAQQGHNAEMQKDLAAVQRSVMSMIRALATLQVHLQVLLLANPSVQADLELSEEQRPRIAEFLEQSDLARSRIFQELGEASRSAHHRRILEAAESRQAMLATILTSQQRERLGQIVLQVQGIAAFQEPDVSRMLNLTLAQCHKIRDIEFNIPVTHSSEPGPPPAPTPWLDATAPNHLQAMNAALNLLTPEQTRRWRQLIGPKFDGLASLRPPEPFGPLSQGP